jgi:hypothetical protein
MSSCLYPSCNHFTISKMHHIRVQESEFLLPELALQTARGDMCHKEEPPSTREPFKAQSHCAGRTLHIVCVQQYLLTRVLPPSAALGAAPKVQQVQSHCTTRRTQHTSLHQHHATASQKHRQTAQAEVSTAPSLHAVHAQLQQHLTTCSQACGCPH